MFDVEMPDGTIIEGVPDGTTQADLMSRYQKMQTPAQTIQQSQTGWSAITRPAEEYMAAQRQRGADLADAVNRQDQGQQNPASTALQVGLHNVGGGLAQLPITAVEMAAKALYQGAPQPVQNVASSTGQAIAQSPAGQEIGQLANQYQQNEQTYAKQNPEAAANYQAIREGVNLLPLAPEVRAATEAGMTTTGNALKDLATNAGEIAAKTIPTIKQLVRIEPGQISPLLQDISERGIDETGAFKQLREQLGNEAANLQEKISGKFEDGKKVAPGLFDIAKERGNDAYINSSAINTLSQTIKQQAGNEVGSDVVSLLNNTASKLDGMLEQTPSLNSQGIIGKPQVSLNDMETLRRSLSGISKERTAAGNVAGQVVKKIDTILTPDNIMGDKDAVNIWKEAISKRREFAQKFEEPQELALSITNEPNEVIEKKFLGSGPLSSKSNLGLVYDNTLKALPPEQRPGASFLLKQAMVNRMIRNSGLVSDSEEGVSAARLANQIRNLRRENQTIWNKFNPQEKDDLRRLEDKLRTSSQGGVVNKVGGFLVKMLSKATRSSLELPRTIKPKTIFTVDDIAKMTATKPKFRNKIK